MTFSLLARDPESGAIGGAAATGNLCVGAWVLRGKAGVGMSASQGHFPSTLWGETVLDEMAKGATPTQAVHDVVTPDQGREARQLLALDQTGQAGVFSGKENVPTVSELVKPGIGAAGNMLSDASVIKALVSGYETQQGSFLRKLLAGLVAGAEAGGDARGLMSAAILILSENHPPIDLRVDLSDDPLGALSDLVRRVEGREYAQWMQALPTTSDPYPCH